jgi:site-specific DNA-methyltransferase (adenine-specific)
MKKYQIIYADPPWFYNKRNLFGKDGKRNNFAWGATNHYSVMKTKDICALPIRNIVDENCILFLWATFPRLIDATSVITAWGFEYKTVGFVWIKTMKNGGIRMDGLGNYTMSNAEICLIATKGKVHRENTGVKQIILHQKTRHSEKPAEVRTRIVKLMGDLPRIELFARQKTEGWTCIGNDIDGMDIKESLDKLIAQ